MTDARVKTVDIETLLAWCYCDELPKRDWLDVGGRSPWEAMMAQLEGGQQLDDGRPSLGNRYAVLGGSGPHPDAVLVHEAVKRLDDPALTPVLEDAAGLVCDMPPEVQEAAEEALSRYAVRLAPLVMRCALRKRRPDWRVDAVPELVPVRSEATGRPQWFALREVSVRSGGRMTVEVPVTIDPKTRRYPDDAYRRFAWEPDVKLVIDSRADYQVWWGALAWLAGELDGRLANHRVTPPGAAPWPWETGERPAPRVLHDVRTA